MQPCRSLFPAQAPRLAKDNANAVGAVTLCDIAQENPIQANGIKLLVMSFKLDSMGSKRREREVFVEIPAARANCTQGAFSCNLDSVRLTRLVVAAL